MSRTRDGGSCPRSSRLSHIVNPGSAGPHSVVFGRLCPDRPRALLIFTRPLVIRLVIKWNQASQIVSEVVFRLWSAYFSHPLVVMRRATAPREGKKNKNQPSVSIPEKLFTSWRQKRVKASLRQAANSNIKEISWSITEVLSFQQSKNTQTCPLLADQSRK